MIKPTLLVLAAGMGSRYGGDKQIDGFGPNNETIIEYSIFDSIRAGFGKVVFIVREEILDVTREKFLPKLEGKIEVEFVIQSLDSMVPPELKYPERTKPYGTAHALLCAKSVIKEPFAVINADDFYGSEAFAALGDFLTTRVKPDLHCMVGYAIKNVLSEYGSVSRGVCETDQNKRLIGMTERTSISRENGKIIHREGGEVIEIHPDNPVSMNCWGFHPSFFEQTEVLWKEFLQKNKENLKSEFYIPMVANSVIQQKKAEIELLKGGDIWFGVTYSNDRKIVNETLYKLHEEGIYPEKLW